MIEGAGDPQPDDQDLASFGAHLDEFAATLTDRERALLASLVLRGLDPLSRIELRGSGLLTPDEDAVVQELLEN